MIPITAASAQEIDEPGVHLVDAARAREHSARSEATTAQAPGGAPDRCLRAGNADVDTKRCLTPVDETARDANLEAAKRSGIEIGTPVLDRNAIRPIRRSH